MSDQRSGTPGREEAVPSLTRKGLLVLGGAGLASAAAMAGCGDESDTEAFASGDVDLLNEALKLEHSAVTLYRESGEVLGGNVGETARVFAAQAAKHVAHLVEVVEAHGGTPLEAPPRRERRRKLGLPGIDRTSEFLEIAIRFENTTVAGYIRVVGELDTPEFRRTFYELAENAAAHLSVLLGLAGEVQVPDPLVTGQSR